MAKSETRKDYVTNTWVIFAGERVLRPHFSKQKEEETPKEKCPFCPHNPHKVNVISKIERNGKWQVQAIENIYPIVAPIPFLKYGTGKRKIFDKPFYRHFPIPGQHEVIVDTRNHRKEVYNGTYADIVDLLDMYVSRTKDLLSQPGIKYVSIFKNRGKIAGASISHPHSQIVALPFTPKIIKSESKKPCVFCQVVKHERESPRMIYENKTFLVISPYAAKFPFEIWFLPKRHVKDITELTDEEKYGLADCINLVLPAMEKMMGPFPYNWAIHQAPKNKDFHFHLELYPRTTKWAGLELGSHVYVNVVMPEDVAIDVKKHL